MKKLLTLAFLLIALGVVPMCTPAGSTLNSVTQGGQGNPSVKVWVNIPTHVYHCPGDQWYGTTKKGEYMTQKQAQDAGNRPANGRYCQ